MKRNIRSRIAGTVFVFTFAWLVAAILGIEWDFFEPLVATVSAGLAWFIVLSPVVDPNQTGHPIVQEKTETNNLPQMKVEELLSPDRAIAQKTLEKWNALSHDFQNNLFTREHPKERYTKILAFSYWLEREYWQISNTDFQSKVKSLAELLNDFSRFCETHIIYKPSGPPYYEIDKNKIKPGIFGDKIRAANEKSQEIFLKGNTLHTWLSSRL